MSTSVVLFNGLGSNDEPGLWVTDGTAAGTSELSVELSTGLNPQFITNFNGKALFAGADPSSTDDGLWVTDGTAAGTSEIGGPGSTGISEANFDGLQPGYFQVYKGEALFRGAAGLAGGEVFGLWVTDGTAAGTSEIGGNENAGIKNADTGGLLKDPPDFTPFNGKVLFRGWDNKGEVGLWVTNGTATGTSELAPIAGAAFGPTAPPTGFDIQPQYMAVLGNKVLFDGADQEDTAGSLWVTNGTVAGTTEVGGEGNKGIKNVPFSDPAGDLPDGLQPYGLTTFGSEVLFAGQDDTLFHGDTYNHTFALWESNGTAAGTTEIGGFGNSEITEANSAANGGIFDFGSVGNPDFTIFKSEVLFIGLDADNHLGLWVTNGTASGTTEVGGLDGVGLSEVLNFSNTVNPDFTVYGSEVLFDGLDSLNHATLWKTDGTAAGTSEIGSQGIAPEDMTLFTSGAQLAVTSVLQNPSSGSGADLKAGATVSITLVMTEDAIVSGTPKLNLNDGGVATYASGSGTPDLTFKYAVASGQNTPDLQVTSTSLVGATITDAGGFSADLSRVSGTDLGIKIDTIAPTVNSISANPSSGTTLKLGGTAKIDLDLSEAVIVSRGPTLKLSDGGTAIYNSAASTPATGVLEFDYTVTSHQSTSDLTIVSASLAGGASITDLAGNAANLALSATEKNLNLGVNGIPPVVTAATAVASPPGTDITSGGTVAITLKLSQAVTVSGTPFLELSDGGSAQYVSSLTSSSLMFDYNVGSESTTDLRITGVSGAIADSTGNDLSSSLTSDLKLEVNVFTFTHTTSGGGIWNSSTNWTPQEVPGAGNTALITKTGTYTVSSTQDNSVAVIDTAVGATLVVGGGTVFDVTAGTGTGTNAGKIKLANGGTLELGGTFVNNGSITLSGTTSVTALELDGATISGGRLQTLGPSALIKTVAGSNFLHGVTIVSGSYVEVESGTQLTLSGGTISSAATASAKSGSTAIMSGLVTDAGTLALNGVTSVGTSATLEGLAGGTAILSGAVTNSGTLFASGAHSLIDIASGATVTGGGIAKIANGAVDIEGPGDNQNVIFLAGGTGTLEIADTLGNASTFAGHVSGFGQNVHQFIDLTGVAFTSGAVSASYSSSTASSGVLTVTSGGSANVVAAIDLMGHYVTSNFHIVAGPGGTVEIFDPQITKTPTDPFGPANLILFTNYLAAAFPGIGHYGSGLISDLPQAGSEPILTHPRG